MADIWGISSTTGGVLKTTLTINLAGIISKTKKVLIVDTSSQGNCIMAFGKDPREIELTTYDVLMGQCPAEKAVIPIRKNIDILAANSYMSVFDIRVLTNLSEYPNPFQLLRNVLLPLNDKYDVILVDAPANQGIVIGNVLSYVDRVLIPFQLQNNAIRELDYMIGLIYEYKEAFNAKLSILGVVPTLYEQQSTSHSLVLNMTKQYCSSKGIHVFDSKIPYSIQSASSVAYYDQPSTLMGTKYSEVIHYHELLREIEYMKMMGEAV